MMLITDLSFLENVSENDLIFGGGDGALVGVGAYASAEGDDTLAVTNAIAIAPVKVKKHGAEKSIASGTAVAYGEDPVAVVIPYGEGDIVKTKSKTKYKDDMAIATGSVKVIDLPNK